MSNTDIRILRKSFHIPFRVGVSAMLHPFHAEENTLVHPIHRHEFIEIAYTRKGSAVHTVDGVQYPVKRGDVIIMDSQNTHSHVCEDETAFINVLIDPAVVYGTQNALLSEVLALPVFGDFADSMDEFKRVVHFRENERARVEGLLANLMQEYRMMAAGCNAVLNSQVTEYLTLIFRKMSGVDKRSFKLSPDFLKYIRDNCEQKLNLSELARGHFYNPSYFSRLFHDHYGITLTDFIINARYERACELLATTELSTEDIAARCGFGSKSSFYKIFRDKSGMTPKEYRKNGNRQ